MIVREEPIVVDVILVDAKAHAIAREFPIYDCLMLDDVVGKTGVAAASIDMAAPPQAATR